MTNSRGHNGTAAPFVLALNGLYVGDTKAGGPFKYSKTSGAQSCISALSSGGERPNLVASFYFNPHLITQAPCVLWRGGVAARRMMKTLKTSFKGAINCRDGCFLGGFVFLLAGPAGLGPRRLLLPPFYSNYSENSTVTNALF